ncbi:MAG: hypothetical protein H0Z29_04450 [Candidatus Marinimicrobia bacterium]|nr:hypothetical protein [Candidatus Neomarinimicrobiota bacterium]
MKWKLKILILLLIGNTFAYVPRPSTGYPEVPYLYEIYNFTTVKSLVYPDYSLGMYVDKFADLNLNPVYIVKFNKNSIYFDFGSTYSYYRSYIPLYTRIGFDIDDFYGPGWLYYSYYGLIDQSPLYNLGLVFSPGNKLNLFIYNRAIFDYGAFYGYPSYGEMDRGDYFLQSLGNEVKYDTSAIFGKKNQQEIFGFQPGLIAGYELNSKMSIAFKLEYLSVNRDGEMYNSYWKENPHNYYYYLDDIDVDISGKHMLLGIGLLYKLTEKISTGIFAGTIFGNSSQTENAMDTSKTWKENALNPDYYNFNYRYYDFWKANESDGKSRYLNFNIENRLNEKFIIRTGLLFRSSSLDYSMKFLSDDTSYSDKVYDYYDDSDESYHKRRFQNYRKSIGNFNGDGNKESNNYSIFNSFIFMPDDGIRIFTGIYLSKHIEKIRISERYLYTDSIYTVYTIYKPSDSGNLVDYERLYEFTKEYKKMVY